MRWLALLILALPTAVLTGCAPQASTSSSTPTWSIVALGDSVPAGDACGCTPYPELSASDFSSPGGPAVTASNEAVGGFTTRDVLHQLSGTRAAVVEVKSARLVEIEVGANDVAHSSSCGTDVDCYRPKLSDLSAKLHDIVTRVHELVAGHAVDVVLLDYWSVWLGGQYAHEQGQAYVDAAATLTKEVNTVIRNVAAQTGSAYVDLLAAFKGPDYNYDETHYLAPDGEHPNAAGHEKIAAALAEVVQERRQGT